MSRIRFGKLMPSVESYEHCKVYEEGPKGNRRRVIFAYEIDMENKARERLVSIAVTDTDGEVFAEGDPQEMQLLSAILAAALDSELGV